LGSILNFHFCYRSYICCLNYKFKLCCTGKLKLDHSLNQFTKYKGINLAEDAGLEGACWDGYEAIGTKILDGREVPNCVPIKE
jgi:hypothetical protein